MREITRKAVNTPMLAKFAAMNQALIALDNMRNDGGQHAFTDNMIGTRWRCTTQLVRPTDDRGIHFVATLIETGNKTSETVVYSERLI